MRSREEHAAAGLALGARQIARAADAGLSPNGQSAVSLATGRVCNLLQSTIAGMGLLAPEDRAAAVMHFLRNVREGLDLLDEVADEIAKAVGQ